MFIDKEEREKQILKDLLILIESITSNNLLFTEVYRVLKVLNEKDQLFVQLVQDEDDGPKVMGFYSSLTNKIAVVVRKSNFEKKFFGLMTDYDTINKESLEFLMYTFAHELMHYCAHNYTIGFRKIWNNAHRMLLKDIMITLASEYSELFMPIEIKEKKASKIAIDPKFNRVFDAYYNSARISDMMRMVSLNTIYNQTIAQIYKTGAFEWARFFDNVLIAAISIMEGELNAHAAALFKTIKNSYLTLWPALKDSKKFKSLFYQEILYPSEISCILVGSGANDKSITDLGVRTLRMISN